MTKNVHTHTHMCVCVYVYIYTPVFFIHSYIDGHLDYFHFLASINSAAMNIGVHIAFLFKLVFSFFPAYT